MPHVSIAGLTPTHWLLVGVALGVVCAFEFVNGFHDTANAVATVIYTRSLRPWVAVVWSGFWNFLGVYLGGVAVAFSIVHLLPVELLAQINTHQGLAMVFALLGSAILWNFGTWYLALPASSSHALIGAILGVGLANRFLPGHGAGSGVNWSKAAEVGLSLLLSPLIGFCMAALLLLLLKRIVATPKLYEPPGDEDSPPGWIRAILILTCTGVSFAHGSNDGQKGVGMVMLILIGLAPAHYALNLKHDAVQIAQTSHAAQKLAGFLERSPRRGKPDASDPVREAEHVGRLLLDRSSYDSLAAQERWELRSSLLELDAAVRRRMQQLATRLDRRERERLSALRVDLVRPIEYAPTWVELMVALSLGVGTTIGWKRIVVTVGERIGKMHLTYGQGACAELVAMLTIGLADRFGFPVSTTQVLSSAVAGTMSANRAGVQSATVRKIALAWVLTLPATMLLAGLFLWVFRLFL
ncbi:MAG TPA: inorganic phosphate transporter [Pirellulales bacterium]|nr:inorganic phosphate transporter [Pirellulales bacterium]